MGFSHFLFSDIARFNSYDEFLAGLADYEIKTTSRFVVTKSFKEFKEYGKITNMSVGVNRFIYNVCIFFILDILMKIVA